MGERRYDDRELAKILRTAAELQEAAPQVPTEAHGLTLSEIQRIAGEVGIDPVSVEAAAARLEPDDDRRQSPGLGGAAKRMVRERVVEGTIDESAWEDVVSELRRRFECTGTSSIVGSSREWSAQAHYSAIHLTATSRGGRTRLRIAYNQLDGIWVTWLLASLVLMLSLIGFGVWLGGHAISTAILGFLIVAAIVVTTANRFLANWHSRNSMAIDSALDRLAVLVSSGSASQVTSSSDRTSTQAVHEQARY